MDSRSSPDKSPESSEPRPRLSPFAWVGLALISQRAQRRAMTTRTHFLYRVDMWTIDGEKVMEQLAGIEDFQVAMATYRVACERWPGTSISLRQGERVIESPSAPEARDISVPLAPQRLREGGRFVLSPSDTENPKTTYQRASACVLAASVAAWRPPPILARPILPPRTHSSEDRTPAC